MANPDLDELEKYNKGDWAWVRKDHKPLSPDAMGFLKNLQSSIWRSDVDWRTG